MWLIRYNDYFDTLICKFSNDEIDNKKDISNATVFYSNDKVAGLNIFKPNIKKDIKYRLWDEQLILYINDFLKQNKLSIEFDNKPKFTICKIIDCADVEKTNLKICKVNVGDKIIQIVTNAKNARNDLITVVAQDGCFLPDGTYIGKSKIKDIVSEGMFCSAITLDINDKFDQVEGILELNHLEDKIGENIFLNI